MIPLKAPAHASMPSKPRASGDDPVLSYGAAINMV